MKTHSREAGFTLIELMIVVAIVAILSAVAYPSYKEYIAKGRRAEMKTVLLSAQQWMERFYTENYRYDKDSADANVALPDHLKVSPPVRRQDVRHCPGDGETRPPEILLS